MGKKETNKKLEFEFDNRLDNVEFDNPVESGNIESPNGSPRNGLPSPIAGDQAAEVFDTVDAGNVKTKNGSSNQLDTMVPESLIQNSSGENTESYNNWRQFLQAAKEGNGGEESTRDVRLRVAIQYIADHNLVSPDSMFRATWDSMQIFLLGYVAISVPYRIGFGKDVAFLSGWFWVDLVIDLYFIIDMFVSFRTAYYTPDGELEYRAKDIGAHYLRGWFTIDIMSCLPVNYVGYTGWVDANSPNMKTNKLVRLLRLLRLLKLLRIERLAKLKRMVSQYEQNHFGLMALFKIMRPVGVVAWIGHWMACAWFFFGTSEGQAKDEQGNLLKGWVARYFGGDSTIDDQTQYGMAFYWSMMTMTTVGYGDISPQTAHEYWFAAVAMLIGGFVFGMIVSFLGDLSKDANPQKSLQAQTIAMMNSFVVKYEKSPELTRRTRNFMTQQMATSTAMDTLAMLRMMPWSMAEELAVNMRWLDGFNSGQFQPGYLHKISFFQGLPAMSICKICRALKHSYVRISKVDPDTGDREYIFKQGELGSEFWIIITGVVCLEVDGELVGKAKEGDMIGEVAVLTPPEFEPRRMRSAWAEWETHLASLSYYDLCELREKDSAINDAIVPFMKEVCQGKELSNDMLYGDDGDVHDRMDELQGSIASLERKVDAKLNAIISMLRPEGAEGDQVVMLANMGLTEAEATAAAAKIQAIQRGKLARRELTQKNVGDAAPTFETEE